MNAHAGVDASPRLLRWCALLVAVVAGWQVREVVGFDFVEFDDGINLVFNPHLGPLSRETIGWAFTDMDHMRRYVPLGWLGFAAVYGWSGLSPAGYHAAGAALHVLNSLLVFAIVLALLRRFGGAAGAGGHAVWSTWAALAWSLHPLRAETVGWASGLFYGLSGAAALLSVRAYLRAGEPGVHRVHWVMLAAALHLAGMLAYPMSLGVVVVVVLIDVAARGADAIPWRKLAWEKLWFAGPTCAVLALTMVASHTAPTYWVRPPQWAEFGLWDRLLQAAAAWGYFVWRPFWPADLTPVPTWLFDADAARGGAIASLAVVVAISVGLVAGRVRWRGVAILWFAHAGLLAPMLGFFEQPYFPADRYTYLAGVVLVAAVALGATRCGERIRLALAWGGAAAVVMLGLAQREQLRIWKNTDTLMACIVQRAEHPAVRQNYQERWINFHAHRGQAEAAARVRAESGGGRPRAVAPSASEVPPIPALHVKLALDLVRAARWVEAREQFAAALRLLPDWNEAAYNLALLHAINGEAGEAWRWYQRAVGPGRGNPVPVASRQRVLLLTAEGFFAQGCVTSALRAVELALREGGGSGADAALDRELQARLATYVSAPSR